MKRKSFFTIIELAIVMAVMLILSLLVFVVVRGLMNSGKTQFTNAIFHSTMKAKESVFTYYESKARLARIQIYDHPIFKMALPSNRVNTLRDFLFEENELNINLFEAFRAVGGMDVDNAQIPFEVIKYGTEFQKTITDAWHRPMYIIRNEILWHEQNRKKGEDILNMYGDRKKTTVTLYGQYFFDISAGGKNLYEWHDSGFINEYSVLDATTLVPTDTILGKIAVPYTKSGFDVFSAGADGLISNLAKKDNAQDRWHKLHVESSKDNEKKSLYFLVWSEMEGMKAGDIDVDNDNVENFHPTMNKRIDKK